MCFWKESRIEFKCLRIYPPQKKSLIQKFAKLFSNILILLETLSYHGNFTTIPFLFLHYSEMIFISKFNGKSFTQKLTSLKNPSISCNNDSFTLLFDKNNRKQQNNTSFDVSKILGIVWPLEIISLLKIHEVMNCDAVLRHVQYFMKHGGAYFMTVHNDACNLSPTYIHM